MVAVLRPRLDKRGGWMERGRVCRGWLCKRMVKTRMRGGEEANQNFLVSLVCASDQKMGFQRYQPRWGAVKRPPDKAMKTVV